MIFHDIVLEATPNRVSSHRIAVTQGDAAAHALNIRITDRGKEIDYSVISSATVFFLRRDDEVVAALATHDDTGITCFIPDSVFALEGPVICTVMPIWVGNTSLQTERFVMHVGASIGIPIPDPTPGQLDFINQVLTAVQQQIDAQAAQMQVVQGWIDDPSQLKGGGGKDGTDGKDGKDGIDGTNGRDGTDGKDGQTGPAGRAATIRIGEVVSVPFGTQPEVVNVGTETDAILNFKLERGQTGSGGGGGGGVTRYDELEGIPTEFNPTEHQHEMSEINGLAGKLDEKADASTLSTLQEDVVAARQVANAAATTAATAGERAELGITNAAVAYQYADTAFNAADAAQTAADEAKAMAEESKQLGDKVRADLIAVVGGLPEDATFEDTIGEVGEAMGIADANLRAHGVEVEPRTLRGLAEGIGDIVASYEGILPRFIVIPAASGKTRISFTKPSDADGVLIRYKTAPWVAGDTRATGVEVGAFVANIDGPNQWHEVSGLTNSTAYYYKAFPYLNGRYDERIGINETVCKAGGLVLEYTFDSISGNQVLDTSGNGYHGTMTGMASSVGVVGNQVFGGVYTSVRQMRMPNEIIPKSFCCWYRRNSTTLSDVVLSNTATLQHLMTIQDATGELSIFNGASVLGSGITISNTNPNFIAAIISDSTLWFYLNGIKSSKAITSATMPAVRDIGRASVAATQQIGYVDQARFFDRALEDYEIAALYNGGAGV